MSIQEISIFKWDEEKPHILYRKIYGKERKLSDVERSKNYERSKSIVSSTKKDEILVLPLTKGYKSFAYSKVRNDGLAVLIISTKSIKPNKVSNIIEDINTQWDNNVSEISWKQANEDSQINFVMDNHLEERLNNSHSTCNIF
eukprot:TRINITY_DN1649_c0_g1_i1.p1 TRINITY_DN1649_c0_g1~~TRINITY_DN1649_c0_g1_i1.p1  ORF type:complete len:143 (+),score=32.63 TRINITY_DN1649_c0_g1_i1:83-511(+)